MGIISYVKPFLNTETDSGLIAYPIKHLRNKANFSIKLHEHLKKIRHTLVAHDDFKQIEPQLLFLGITVRGADFFVPMKTLLTNKCISHPSDLGDAVKIKVHVTSALAGVKEKLANDITKLRSIALENPNQAKELQKFSKHLGQFIVPKEGARLQPSNITETEWLDPIEPVFSEIQNGFRYEAITINQNFYGPEKIKLPNGDEIEIKPS